MKYLKVDQLKQLKDKLLIEKKRLEKELKQFSDENKKVPHDFECRFENVGSEEDDNAQEVAEYEKCKNLENVLETSLQKIVRALKRMEDKIYGVCLNCKQNISFERLSARPESGHCVACKEKLGLD